MKMIQHTVNASTYVADEFEAKDLGAPFKVVLHKSVQVEEDCTSGEIINYKIPDMGGLLAVIAITRVLHPRKLSGPDIKYIRKLLGLKQKDLAKKIQVSVEHLSRCETGALVISPAVELPLRIFALKTALKLHKMKSCEAKASLEEVIDRLLNVIKPVAVADVDDKLELHFGRAAMTAANDNATEAGGPWEANECKNAA